MKPVAPSHRCCPFPLPVTLFALFCCLLVAGVASQDDATGAPGVTDGPAEGAVGGGDVPAAGNGTDGSDPAPVIPEEGDKKEEEEGVAPEPEPGQGPNDETARNAEINYKTVFFEGKCDGGFTAGDELTIYFELSNENSSFSIKDGFQPRFLYPVTRDNIKGEEGVNTCEIDFEACEPPKTNDSAKECYCEESISEGVVPVAMKIKLDKALAGKGLSLLWESTDPAGPLLYGFFEFGDLEDTCGKTKKPAHSGSSVSAQVTRSLCYLGALFVILYNSLGTGCH